MADVVIIGSGPAGVSASLYTARAGLDTVILSKGSGALGKTDAIQNYYGFADVISGADLEKNGIEGAKKVGVHFEEAEVVGLGYEDKLVVQTSQGSWKADYVLLATGTQRKAPKIPGLQALEGRGVSYCAVCDAFFYRQKPVAVLGTGEYALHEADALLPVASSVSVFTNGDALTVEFPENVKIVEEKIQEIAGSGKVEGIVLENGESIPVEGVFIALGTAGGMDLARKMGAPTEGNKILVDDKMRTGIPGLYAAGDCTGGFLQIAKAVYEGAVAGTEIVKEYRKNKKEAAT